jgi:16S rRNA (adenine1518-N6/adenine1519-N6)-dimethyltransferase
VANAARKRFGQHFLRDSTVVEQIVAAIDAQPGDTVLEIGPGRGALTSGLLASGCTLHAIELDRDLAPLLRERFAGEKRFHLHEGDALNLTLDSLQPAPTTRWRIVGNLPYNISTPLLFHLLAQYRQIEDLHVMLQREVVERMAASPGGRDYGRLTVMLAPFAEVEALFDVPPESFSPPPKVWSTVARLRLRSEPAFAIDARFGRVVLAAFSQRRKTLRNALRNELDAAAIEACGVDPGMRAETLTPAEFGKLALAARSS